MEQLSNRALQQFKLSVGVKFQLYNSLFTSLPFNRIEKTGILLSLLANNCEEGYNKGLSPVEILDEFFSRHTSYSSTKDQLDLLFRFVQYVERQVVLFDALEDAGFAEVHDVNGQGTIKHLESEVIEEGKQEELAKKLHEFCVRLVLTAHPTQFYPGPVLGIIHDLSRALSGNDTNLVNTLLQQLGKTPFLKKQKPTPYDEAISLIWYLENVFYKAAGMIVYNLKSGFPGALSRESPIIRMGFWPGGDMDGNPFVTGQITLRVARALRESIIKCYYLDVRKLKRRLTFANIDVLLSTLESKLYSNLFTPGEGESLSGEEILHTLEQIREIIISQHNGLFLHLVESLITRVEIFGLHFASLDIRQESSIHGKLLRALGNVIPGDFDSLDNTEKMKLLSGAVALKERPVLEDPVLQNTFDAIASIERIQEPNGPDGCNRYVISHCRNAIHPMEVYALFLLNGWKKEEINIDIVPLFETIDDLKLAGQIMEQLYGQPAYRHHLSLRGNRQTIMLGFSDGTKDGGYLMANWSIYKAKEELTSISRKMGIDVVFFDGRGGPPSRGGGKTHKFYASMGKNISNKEIQLTIQGQTVSSNFGIVDAARYNMEQLLHAGISNALFSKKAFTLSEEQESLMQELADIGYQAYVPLRDHPQLTDYLVRVSPLRFYSETNIGSRPSKRGSSTTLSLKDLRAIPFAGSWSQLKQNVPGYFGVGSALRYMEKEGKFEAVRKMYRDSLFFKTLLDNCEMAMLKSFFPLTSYIQDNPAFGGLWKMIRDEYELTREYLFRLSGHRELMQDYPVDQLSIQMRERIVLPLLTIQQYALKHIRDIEADGKEDESKQVYEKLVMRCSFGIINAGRNSA